MKATTAPRNPPLYSDKGLAAVIASLLAEQQVLEKSLLTFASNHRFYDLNFYK